MTIITFDKTGEKVKLGDISEDPPKNVTREQAAEELAELGQEMFELQDLLWGARTHSVLIVLQGRDSAGKDGAIKHVAGYLNPRGVHVTSFGVPTEEEREHDFLWRIHYHAPRKGEFAIFNRSHYEDVLVVRVHDLVPKEMWGERYGHIRDFEELLTEHGTIVLKFFLHISKDEQKKRLLAREQDPRTAWKINAGDWEDRELWDEYTDAYEDAISRTATKHAPWLVVPADAKWYRNLVVARAVTEAMRPHKKTWQARLDQVGVKKKSELETYMRTKKNP
ncbi:PPK2 family polyphosphate kinase [Polyangium aurulentum]|uniref:PPK2 family polyphosphate kinase n=1 Tax=Polyangium aurulentum TaxID=2567896 RepID=UPI0010AE8D76|nr:PPK2 family polyphosphate kinase [Polyangium aurulentum]UQA61891.1 polyphosphate kinase 2 family protein [Polyangium aurulentum]